MKLEVIVRVIAIILAIAFFIAELVLARYADYHLTSLPLWKWLLTIQIGVIIGYISSETIHIIKKYF